MAFTATVVDHPARKKPQEVSFTPIVAGHLEGIPETPEFIVDGLIPKRDLTLLAGPAGVGKTFFVEQLMVSVALGRPWVGFETHQCRSLALFGEDLNGQLHQRRNIICEYEDVDPSLLDDFMRWTDKSFGRPLLYQFSNRFAHSGAATPLWDMIVEHHARCKEELLIIDNASLAFDGFTDQQVTSFLFWLMAQAEALDIAILMLAHPNKANDHPISGVGAWVNRVRQAFALDMPPMPDGEPRMRWDHTDERRLWIIKGNYIPPDHPLRQAPLLLKQENGVMVPVPAEGSRALSESEKAELDGRVLAGVEGLVNDDKCVERDELARLSFPARAHSKRSSMNGWWRYTPSMLAASVDRLHDQQKLVAVYVKGRNLTRGADQRYHSEVGYQSLVADAAE